MLTPSQKELDTLVALITASITHASKRKKYHFCMTSSTAMSAEAIKAHI